MILSLDVGDRRVGTALSDNDEKFAYPHEGYERAGGRAEKEILHLIKDRQISVVVVGLPLGEHDERNEQCLKVEQFSRRIAKRAAVKLIFVDEYGSTEEAKERLLLSGRDERKIR